MRELYRRLDHYGPLVGIILCFTLLRVVIAPSFGLGVDEAHYLLYARYLDFSYVDHPPLVGWIHFVCGNGHGFNEFFARVPAVILMALTTFLAYDFLIKRGVGYTASLWGVIALNSSFIFGALGLMLLPENPLLIATFLIIRCVENLEISPSWQNYLFLGLWLGIAGLSKYTAILFVPSLLIYVIFKKRWDILFSPKIFVSIGVGALVVLPVVVWNMGHEWISFVYQSDHVTGSQTMAMKPFIKSLTAQFGGYSPLLFMASLVGFVVAFRHKAKMALPLAIGGVVALFFIFTSFLKPSLPHWSALFYLLFIPYGVAWGIENFTKTTKVIVVFSLGLSILVHAELGLKVGSFGAYNSPFRDIVGYESIVAKSNEILLTNPKEEKGIMLLNWTYASRFMAYNQESTKVYLLDEKNKQFGLWSGTPPLGGDFLIVTSHFEKEPQLPECKSFEHVGSFDTLLNGEKVDTFEFVWCRGYKGGMK